MEVRRLRTLALETFKTLNYLNPAPLKNLFAKQEVSKRNKNNLEIPNRNTAKYGDKSIRSLGPHIWNGLPYLEWSTISGMVYQKKSKTKLLTTSLKST